MTDRPAQSGVAIAAPQPQHRPRKLLLSPQQVAIRFVLALATRPMTADVIADNLMRLGLKRHGHEVLTSLAGLRGRGLCKRRDAVGGGWEWWSDETIEDLEA